MYQVPDFKCQVSGVGCLVSHFNNASSQSYVFSLANCNTLQCRIGQLVQFFPRDKYVDKPDLFESLGWGFLIVTQPATP